MKTTTFLCGDFNLIPNSLLYQFIDTGKIDVGNVPALQVNNKSGIDCR